MSEGPDPESPAVRARSDRPAPARAPLDATSAQLVTNGHPVLELIAERRRTGSLPGKRSDGATLALVVEGGGMRAAVSGGMVVALEQLGLTGVFDRIYGASGGLFNAVYFLARQATYGSTIYAQDLIDKRFIDFRRYFSSKPVVSLDYAIDEVMSMTRPVDWDAAVASPIELHPIASSLTTYSAIDLGPPRDAEHLREQLRASARIMRLGGDPYEVDGHRCLDASLFMGIPYPMARDQGATHVLVLLTRPSGVVRRSSGIVEKVLSRQLAKIDPRIPETMKTRVPAYRELVAQLERATRDPGSSELPAYAVQMRGPELKQTTQDPLEVLAAAIAGMEAVYALTDAAPQLVSTLLPYA